MSIPKNYDAWEREILRARATAEAKQADLEPWTIFKAPSGSNATLESTLGLQVLWVSRPLGTDDLAPWWPHHPVFGDESLKKAINADSTAEFSRPKQALLELCKLIKRKGTQVPIVVTSQTGPSQQTPPSLGYHWPEAHQILEIQNSMLLSCFTSFARQLAQINIPLSAEAEQKRVDRSRISISMPSSPALQLRYPPRETPQTPSKPSKTNRQILQLTEDNDELNVVSKFWTEDQSSAPKTHTTKYEQTTVVTLITLLNILEGLSVERDRLVVQAGSPPWNFMDSGPGKRAKIWSATADGMILRNGEIVAFLEAKPSVRNDRVRYQESAEFVALVRHVDTMGRDQQSQGKKKRFLYWAIAINGNELFLLIGSWKQPYLDFLESMTVVNSTEPQKESQIERMEHGEEGISTFLSSMSLDDSTQPSTPGGPSSSEHQLKPPHTPYATQPPSQQPQQPQQPHTPPNKQSSTSPVPPAYSNTAPSPISVDSFLTIYEYGPFNLWDEKLLAIFCRLFAYLIDYDLDMFNSGVAE